VYGAAGVLPGWLLPITVDVGTNNQHLQQDPLYIGMPMERVRGRQYEALMMEVVMALQERFHRQVLVHWEDLAVGNAFTILRVGLSLMAVLTSGYQGKPVALRNLAQQQLHVLHHTTVVGRQRCSSSTLCSSLLDGPLMGTMAGGPGGGVIS